MRLLDPRISGGGGGAIELPAIPELFTGAATPPAYRPSTEQVTLTLQALQVLLEGRFEIDLHQAREEGQQNPVIQNLETQRTRARELLGMLHQSIQSHRATSTQEALNLFSSAQLQEFQSFFSPIFARTTLDGLRLPRLHLIYDLIRLEGLPLHYHEQYLSYAHALIQLAETWSRSDALSLSPRSGGGVEILLRRAHQLGLEARVDQFRAQAPYMNTARDIIHRLETREGLIGVGVLAVAGFVGGAAAGFAEALGWGRVAITATRFAGMYTTQNTLELGGTTIARSLEGRNALRLGQVGERLLHNGVALGSGEVFAFPFAGHSLAHFLMFNHGLVMGPELASGLPILSNHFTPDSRPYFAQYLGASVDGAILMGMARPVQSAMAGAVRTLVSRSHVPEINGVSTEAIHAPEIAEAHDRNLVSPASAALATGLLAFLNPRIAHAGIGEDLLQALLDPSTVVALSMLLSLYIGGRLRRNYERREAAGIQARDGELGAGQSNYRLTASLGEVWQKVISASSANELRQAFAEYRQRIAGTENPSDLKLEFDRLHHFLESSSERGAKSTLAYLALVEVFRKLPQGSAAYLACVSRFIDFPHYAYAAGLLGPRLRTLRAIDREIPAFSTFFIYRLYERALRHFTPGVTVVVVPFLLAWLARPLGPSAAGWAGLFGTYLLFSLMGFKWNAGSSLDALLRGNGNIDELIPFRSEWKQWQRRGEARVEMEDARRVANEVFGTEQTTLRPPAVISSMYLTAILLGLRDLFEPQRPVQNNNPAQNAAAIPTEAAVMPVAQEGVAPASVSRSADLSSADPYAGLDFSGTPLDQRLNLRLGEGETPPVVAATPPPSVEAARSTLDELERGDAPPPKVRRARR